jgi:hypothetical protein
LTVRARRARWAEPGVHPVLVMLTTRPVSGGRVKVQARLGVRIRMRVPGRVVRRLRLGRLRVMRGSRTMLVSVANRGNVTVQLHGRVRATLLRRGKKPVRLRPRAQRTLPPGARTFVALRYTGGMRGQVTAVVRVSVGAGPPVVQRRYRFRL